MKIRYFLKSLGLALSLFIAITIFAGAKAEAASVNLSSVKFTFTDPYGETKEFDGGADKIKVIILGGIGSCYNTMGSIQTVNGQIAGISDSDCVVYAFNTVAKNAENPQSDTNPTKAFLKNNGISKRILVGHVTDTNIYKLSQTCRQYSNSYIMPNIYIVDKSGNIVSHCGGASAAGSIIGNMESAGVTINKAAGGVASYSEKTMEVKYGQTEARKQLAMINSFRTGSETWYWNSDDATKTMLTGLSELKYDYDLEKVAMLRAAELAYSYSHTRPNGYSSFSAYEGIYACTAAGENIAYGFDTTESVFVAWREDNEDYAGQGHRRNMLNSSFTTFAVGHVKYNGIDFWVQLFGNREQNLVQTTAEDGDKSVTIQISSSISQNDYAAMGGYTGFEELEHNWIYSNVKIKSSNEWTCSYTADIKCSGCGAVGTLSGSGPHKYSTVVVTESTCGEKGEEKHVCKICAHEVTEDIPATGNHEFDDGVVTKEATYTNAGVKTYTCKKCGTTNTETIPALECTEHEYDEGVVTKEATYTSKGVKTYTCKNCGSTKTEVIPKLEKESGGTTKPVTKAVALKSVKLSYTSATYTGKSLEPSLTIKDEKGNAVIVDSSNVKISYSNNKNVGTATVTVTGTGNYKGTVKATFKINPKGTSISKVTAGSKKFTVKWSKKTTQTTGYQIQYSTSSSFKNGKTVTVSKNSTVSKAVTKLTGKKKYYVRVRTYKTVNGINYYSAWSKSKTVTTKK